MNEIEINLQSQLNANTYSVFCFILNEIQFIKQLSRLKQKKMRFFPTHQLVLVEVTDVPVIIAIKTRKIKLKQNKNQNQMYYI